MLRNTRAVRLATGILKQAGCDRELRNLINL